MARSIARRIISQYETTVIGENRAKIEKDISTELTRRVIIETPMKVISVVSSNFEYPDVVTDAQETLKKNQIEIEQEVAKQELALKRAQNRKKIAQEMIGVRETEAKAEAVYIKILSGVIGKDNYIQLRHAESKQLLAEAYAIRAEALSGVYNKISNSNGSIPEMLLLEGSEMPEFNLDK